LHLGITKVNCISHRYKVVNNTLPHPNCSWSGLKNDEDLRPFRPHTRWGDNKGRARSPPYPLYYHWPLEETELGKRVKLLPFPEAEDLVSPWYFNGKWHRP